MKVFYWLIIVVLMSYHVTAQDDEDEESCEDRFVWCPSQKNQCSISSLVQSFCKETCGVCDTMHAECQTLRCEFGCTRSDDDFICTCADGFRLNDDRRTCSDIDECAGSNPCTDPATPICRNFGGSFACLACAALPRQTTYYESNMCCQITNVTGSCGQNSLTRTQAPSGPNVQLGRFPWTALLDVGGRKCTGVLISDEWILTSANCFSGFTIASTTISAQVGTRSTNPNDSNPFTRLISVTEVIIHENYNFPSNDVALVRLQETVSMSWAVQPICLPNGEIPNEGQRCWMSGFESFFSEEGIEESMLEAGVTITSGNNCRNNLGRIGTMADYDHTLCGEYDFATAANCPGETGGPVVCQRCNSCDWYVAGIMGFGDLCPQKVNSYAAYTSVETYEQWISRHTGMTIGNDGTCASSRVSWMPWSEWSSCSLSCASGSRSRTRTCRNGNSGDRGCEGGERDQQFCNTQMCPRWSDYGEWSGCSVSCGGGSRTRTRTCLGGSIGQLGCHEGSDTETAVCDDGSCAHWADWSDWTGCGQTCGLNNRELRFRSCIDDENEDCEGEPLQFRSCNTSACPEWSNWMSWSECSRSCGGRGVRTATRNCMNGDECPGDNEITEDCLTPTCAPIFTSWSECSVTCGSGVQRRTRICPSDQEDCDTRTETQDCRLQICPPSITRTPWNDCPVSCGVGEQVRIVTVCEGENRQCTSTEERKPCDVPDCPRWSSWSEFGECDVTCGAGTETRERQCMNGSGCEGPSTEMQVCNEEPCPTTPSCAGDQRFWCEFARSLCNTSDTVTQLCHTTCELC